MATLVRIAGLVLVGWTVMTSAHRPGSSGRELAVSLLFAAAVAGWVAWIIRPGASRGLTIEIWVLAAAGGVLCGAAPDTAASAFVFIAVVNAGLRVELAPALPVAAVGALALAGGVLAYAGSALGLLAYALGFAAATLAASNARQSVARADQAELLLAQAQRSHEEQLRVARLEESTRLAREIHDLIAHALAGLTIQLEATSSLIEQGADRETVLARVQRAHDLAREGLRETRLAVGTLRGDPVAAPSAIEALVAEYRAGGEGPAQLTIDGDRRRLAGPVGQAVLRVVQEALTNVRKHSPGASVSVEVHAPGRDTDQIVVCIEDRPAGRVPASGSLAGVGGGYGLRGMRERAEALGGTLSAGAAGDGWRVELRLPGPVQDAGLRPPESGAAQEPGPRLPMESA